MNQDRISYAAVTTLVITNTHIHKSQWLNNKGFLLLIICMCIECLSTLFQFVILTLKQGEGKDYSGSLSYQQLNALTLK